MAKNVARVPPPKKKLGGSFIGEFAVIRYLQIFTEANSKWYRGETCGHSLVSSGEICWHSLRKIPGLFGGNFQSLICDPQGSC